MKSSTAVAASLLRSAHNAASASHCPAPSFGETLSTNFCFSTGSPSSRRSRCPIGALTSTDDLQEQFYCRYSTGARTLMADYYTPELLARVAEIYARDYPALGYPVPD